MQSGPNWANLTRGEALLRHCATFSLVQTHEWTEKLRAKISYNEVVVGHLGLNYPNWGRTANGLPKYGLDVWSPLILCHSCAVSDDVIWRHQGMVGQKSHK